MVIDGKLIQCKREVKSFDKAKSEEKLWISLAEVDLSSAQQKELLEAFKDSGKKFTPDWIQDFKGYANLSTKFALPVKDLDGNIHDSIEEFISEGFGWMGATVSLAINVKEGAVYPQAMIVLKEGERPNPFAEFDK